MRKRRRLLQSRTLLLLLSVPLLTLSLLYITISPPSDPAPPPPPPPPPRLAYLIHASPGDGRLVRRLLRAVYHPWNWYMVRIDSAEEREEFERFVGEQVAFREFGNVRVLQGAVDAVSDKGPTVVAAMLHAVAALLREGREWSWFVNLSADDYPLMSQDDILHVFSYMPRDMNFIEHTSNMGWKEHQRARPVVVDPGLYGSNKTEVFWIKEKRSLPSSFKLFVGSPWVILARAFLEYCVMGWDNLPRTLLMYYTNFVSSNEGYFHTVICNSQEFQNTTINHDMRFTMSDDLPGEQPLNLSSKMFDLMVDSGAPFAPKFVMDDPILDRIDRELLRRNNDGITPGGWCIYGKPDVIRPTANSRRLERLLVKLLDPENFRPKQCI